MLGPIANSDERSQRRGEEELVKASEQGNRHGPQHSDDEGTEDEAAEDIKWIVHPGIDPSKAEKEAKDGSEGKSKTASGEQESHDDGSSNRGVATWKAVAVRAR
jgi:hypothetical protein